MAKAILIAPLPKSLVGKRTRKFHRCFPPLSLLITANILRQEGWEVKLRDLNGNPDLSLIEVQNEAEGYDLVVLTTNPYADWQCPSFEIDPILKFAQQLPQSQVLMIPGNWDHWVGVDMQQWKKSFRSPNAQLLTNECAIIPMRGKSIRADGSWPVVCSGLRVSGRREPVGLYQLVLFPCCTGTAL